MTSPANNKSALVALLLASLACIATFLIVHFLIIRPLQDAHGLLDFRMRHHSAEIAVTFLLYALAPPVAAFVLLLRSCLLQTRRGGARILLLFLISCALYLGVMVVLWIAIMLAFAVSMSQKHGGDF